MNITLPRLRGPIGQSPGHCNEGAVRGPKVKVDVVLKMAIAPL